MEKILSFFMSVLLFFCGAARGSVPEKAEKLRVVSYLVINNAAGLSGVDPSHFKDLTDVIVFGGLAGMNGKGEVVLSDDFDEIVNGLRSMDETGHIRWHLNLGIITQTDLKMEMRKAFHGQVLPRNIRAVLEEYGFDGVFFDYEFPMEWDAKLDFSIFLINLRRSLGDDFLIGAALQPWCARFLPGAVRRGIRRA